MAKKKAKQTNGRIWLADEQLASIRMQAIEVAARLPEPEPVGAGMMATSYTRPGKDAAKVVADAEKLVAFVTKAQ